MANNPVETGGITFAIKGDTINNGNWYFINEPIYMDAAKMTVEQEPKRFARSVRYLQVDKLRLINAWSDKKVTAQTWNELGDVEEYLNYGLEWVMSVWKKKKFETDIEFGIFIDGVLFQSYQFDANDKDITDGYTFFEFKAIDNSKVADYKRHYDRKLNAFSDKGVFEQTVTPLQPVNFLHIAVPKYQESKFKGDGNPSVAISQTFPITGTFNAGSNTAKIAETYEIEDTLGFISNQYATHDESGWQVPNDSNNFTMIRALNDLTNVKIEITDINAVSSAAFPNPNVIDASGKVNLIVVIGNNLETEPFEVHELWSRDFENSFGFDNSPQPVPSSFTLNLDYIERGKIVYIYFSADSTATFSSTVNGLSGITARVQEYAGMKIKISGISTALDVVVKAVSYIDLINQGNVMLHNLPLYAPKFQTGGVFNKQFVYTKRMISQHLENLYFTVKQMFESVEEVCCDVELSDTEMYINHFLDYYQNEEIAVYDEIPSEEYSIGANERFAVNEFKFGFGKFAQDRDIVGSAKSIHTQSEDKIQNLIAVNDKNFKGDLIRDGYLIEDIVNLEIKQPETSVSEDNDLIIEDAIELPAGSFGVINSRLYMRVTAGKLEILNRSLAQDSGNTVINWETQGLGVGVGVEILTSPYLGNYTIDSLNRTVLTLTPVGTLTPVADGDYFIRIKHYYTNVQWQTRTNQQFSLIEGITEQFPNLQYSIARTKRRWWLPYLSCINQYNGKDIINTFFKNISADRIVRTQMVGEAQPITENGNILASELPTPILTGDIDVITITSTFAKEIERAQKYQDQRLKGFIRYKDKMGKTKRGFVQKEAFQILDDTGGKLSLTIEVMYEDVILKITTSGSDVFFNGVQYDNAWYDTANDFVRFYDQDSVELYDFYKYDKIELNGVIYDSINELVAELDTIF